MKPIRSNPLPAILPLAISLGTPLLVLWLKHTDPIHAGSDVLWYLLIVSVATLVIAAILGIRRLTE